jgi:hypothetical protein
MQIIVITVTHGPGTACRRGGAQATAARGRNCHSLMCIAGIKYVIVLRERSLGITCSSSGGGGGGGSSSGGGW